LTEREPVDPLACVVKEAQAFVDLGFGSPVPFDRENHRIRMACNDPRIWENKNWRYVNYHRIIAGVRCGDKPNRWKASEENRSAALVLVFSPVRISAPDCWP